MRQRGRLEKETTNYNLRRFSGFSLKEQLESYSSLEKPLIYIFTAQISQFGTVLINTLSDASENEHEENIFSSALHAVQLTWLAEIHHAYLGVSSIFLVLFQRKGKLWRKWNHLFNCGV